MYMHDEFYDILSRNSTFPFFETQIENARKLLRVARFQLPGHVQFVN